MTLKAERRNNVILDSDKAWHVETLSEACTPVVGEAAFRGLCFINRTRMLSLRGAEARKEHWIPLDETLSRYHLVIRGSSRVLKGDWFRECVSSMT